MKKRNRHRYNVDKSTNAQRPYGTIKRQWGYNYIITKKYLGRVEADFGFIVTAYNLRRLLNLTGRKALAKYKHVLSGLFTFKNTLFHLKLNFLDFVVIKTKFYNYFQTAAQKA